MKHILAADVGGTKVIMALYEVKGRELHQLNERKYLSGDFPDFRLIIQDFRKENPMPVDATGLGVAGPVFERTCKATNLPWTIDARELEATGGLGRVALVNDFKAAALGVLHLKPEQWVQLNPQAEALDDGPIAILGAGTGLGEAFLFHAGGRYHVIPTEGGHTDFAPRNDDEIGLLKYLAKRHGRVSTERVVSGAGLKAIYDYLLDAQYAEESPAVRGEMVHDDPAAVVSRFGLAKADKLCEKALDIFMGCYGAEAGNLALKVIATGGIYVTGGIAPKNLPKLEDGTFMTAFTTKGRFSDLVGSMPLRIVIEKNVGLIGAAAAALELESISG